MHAYMLTKNTMTQDTPTVEDVIKEATNRFLRWKLPEDFAPYCGIEFQKEFNVSYNASQGLPPCKHEPVGTNLFDAQQAKAMVRYILEDALITYGNARFEEGVTAERERCKDLVVAHLRTNTYDGNDARVFKTTIEEVVSILDKI